MIVTTLVPPVAEPVGLAEAKEYLRISGDGEDALVATLIAAARARIEDITAVAMISRTLRVALDGWPRELASERTLRLPVRPAAELVAVRILDFEGAATVVTDRFELGLGRSARLAWTEGGFPAPGRRAGGIEIDYVAGFGESAADVAEGLRLAVKRLAAHAYHARDAETIAGPLPEDVAGLIAPWRRVQL
jgi:uncharacterized phiE125 gp8 family phage protein